MHIVPGQHIENMYSRLAFPARKDRGERERGGGLQSTMWLLGAPIALERPF